MDYSLFDKFIENTDSIKQDTDYILEAIRSYKEAKDLIDQSKSQNVYGNSFVLPISTGSILNYDNTIINTNGKI